MKTILLGNFGHSWDGSVCDEEHIAESLDKLGVQVTRFQREDTNLTDWKLPKADVAIIAQWAGYAEDTIERLKFYVDKVVYWAFDHQAENQDWHQRLIKGSDLYLSKRISDSQFPNWRWLAQDFAPNFLDVYRSPIQGVSPAKDIDVLFTGSHVPFAGDRIEILKEVDKRFNLQVHSVTADQWKAEGLKNVNGPVMDHELPALIARAKINLSVDIHINSPGYWSDRNAQIMACGGLVLYRYVQMSEVAFKNNIIYFYNVKDCLERIERLLEIPQEDRDMIAMAGYTHARRNLMAIHRTQDLVTIIKDIL